MELNSVGDSDRQIDILQEKLHFLLICSSKYFLGCEKYVQNFHQEAWIGEPIWDIQTYMDR